MLWRHRGARYCRPCFIKGGYRDINGLDITGNVLGVFSSDGELKERAASLGCRITPAEKKQKMYIYIYMYVYFSGFMVME